MNVIFVIILNVFELVASLTGFYYWGRIKNSYWRYFPVYLGVIFLTEIVAEYLLYFRSEVNLNISIYRYWAIPLQLFFYYWLYYKYFKGKKFASLPVYFSVIYFAAFLSDRIFDNLNKQFDEISYSVGSILLLILIFCFISAFTRSREIFRYKSSRMFWVTIGLLLFYIGSLPYWPIRTYLFNHYPDLGMKLFYFQFILNYVMYIFFIFSFIWGKER